MTRPRLFVVLAVLLLSSASAQAVPSKTPYSVVRTDERTWVFERPGVLPGETQGLVVDSQILLESLKSRVIDARGLGEVVVLRKAASARGSEDPNSYAFTHRFAAPFSMLSLSLHLRKLADPDEGRFVYPLAGLLALSIVAGLYALYRMAATQVRFAERRNDFVSAVSHELKSPLTAIRMHAEMLEDDLIVAESKRHEYYRTITRESERLTRLIENVLAFSRLERKTQKLQIVAGDVTPVIEECLEVLRPHAESHGARLEFENRAGHAAVRCDPDALKQVLFNLIDNAVKYGSTESDPTIQVVASRCDGGVSISVRDRGPGVRRDQLDLIFEPFFRAEHELTRRTTGTGIGLSLVRELVVAMGGRVRAEAADPGLSITCELSC
jgi:signal transduction histidine kinase